jgi:hypothetical protein
MRTGGRHRGRIIRWLALAAIASAIASAAAVAPPSGLVAHDTPNDPGGSIDLTWQMSADDRIPAPGESAAITVRVYRILRAAGLADTLTEAGTVLAGDTTFTDSGTRNGIGYYYRVEAIGSDSSRAQTSPAGPVGAQGQWFDTRKSVLLGFVLLFCGAVLYLIRAARAGKELYIRPIPGLAAVDEAIGRATEMGRPILFIPGLGVTGEVATLAAFTMLGRVAKKTAEYQTRVRVPCYDPMVMTIAQDIVKSSYLDAGYPEMYREEDVFFVTQDQFSYVAAVNGMMIRERPATNFYIGKFYAESLILAETGNIAGSIQIAGTDEIIQIPFFIASCDYTLIGEELYAASAYLSREPPLLGTLKGQDWGKAAMVTAIVLGTIAATLGWHGFVDFFATR